MAGREVREYTNLSDPKDKKLGKGKDRIDDEDITFQRMVAKMQEVAGERGGYLHGRGALDSDDLLYLKEQMEAEEDAERLLRRTEKRAFAAFKISFFKCLLNVSFIVFVFLICAMDIQLFESKRCNCCKTQEGKSQLRLNLFKYHADFYMTQTLSVHPLDFCLEKKYSEGVFSHFSSY